MRFFRQTAGLLLVGIAVGSTAIKANEPNSGSETYCALFSKVRVNLSGSFGLQIDPLTRFSGLEVMCDHKAIVFRQDIGLKKPEIDDSWVARR